MEDKRGVQDGGREGGSAARESIVERTLVTPCFIMDAESARPNGMRLAILYDPVKLVEEPGYPSPALEAVIAEYAPEVAVSTIALQDLIGDKNILAGFTALCIPGGFAPNYSSRLGERGIAIIRDFVANGGGYLGICAGAYLGSSICLNLLPITCVDMHRWARGTGPCQLTFTRFGSAALGAPPPSVPCDCFSEHSIALVEESDDQVCAIGSGDAVDGGLSESEGTSAAATVTVRYANGPMMQIDAAGAAAAYAVFATEFRGLHAGTREGSRLEGSPAVVVGRSGAMGLVALVSPHLEDGSDVRSLLPLVNLLRLVSRGSLYQQWVLQSPEGLGLDAAAPAWAPAWAGKPGRSDEVRWLGTPPANRETQRQT